MISYTQTAAYGKQVQEETSNQKRKPSLSPQVVETRNQKRSKSDGITEENDDNMSDYNTDSEEFASPYQKHSVEDSEKKDEQQSQIHETKSTEVIIKIVTWNCKGIKNWYDNQESFEDAKVICINETWLVGYSLMNYTLMFFTAKTLTKYVSKQYVINHGDVEVVDL